MNTADAGVSEFAVLNPWGRDPETLYPGGPTSPLDNVHPPVNYHAYAACVRGGWYRDYKRIPAQTSDVLILLRTRRLRDAASAMRYLKDKGKRCWISWKESGLHQIAAALNDPSRYRRFSELCRMADGFISSTPEAVAFYRNAGARFGETVPTPYPLEYPRWDLSTPVGRRSGVFVGTREFDVPSRNHLLAILTAYEAANKHQTHVTVISTSRQDRRMLESLNLSDRLQIVDGPIPYADYVLLMGRHRAVFQLDSSFVPGQVAGDSLLARVPCVGGNGAVDRLARFPAPDHESPEATLDRILSDPELAAKGFEQTWTIAMEELSFQAGATKLARLCLSPTEPA